MTHSPQFLQFTAILSPFLLIVCGILISAWGKLKSENKKFKNTLLVQQEIELTQLHKDVIVRWTCLTTQIKSPEDSSSFFITTLDLLGYGTTSDNQIHEKFKTIVEKAWGFTNVTLILPTRRTAE